MTTEIRYRDIFGNLLSPEQLEIAENDYGVEQYLDGQLKRIDFYSDGDRDGGMYYLSPDDDLSTVLNDVKEIWNNAYIYVDSQNVGEFIIRNWEIYKGLDKISKGKTGYDNQGREIANQYLDLSTSVVLKTTKKYYLQNLSEFSNEDNIPGFGVLDFDYNYDPIPAGMIMVLVNLPGFEHKEYYIDNQQNILLNPLIARVFSWNDETYYHNTSPFIPI